jgi:autotransporter translocation and assembly factor TamB
MVRRFIAAAVVAGLTGSSLLLAQQGTARVDMRLEAARLSFEELARLIPAFEEITLPPDFRVTRLDLRGPLEAMAIEFTGQARESHVAASVVADLQGPTRAIRGTLHLRRINLAQILGRADLPTDLTADARVNLHVTPGADGPHITGDYELRTPVVSFAGYRADTVVAKGRVEGQRVTVDARLRAYGTVLTARGHGSFGREGAGYRIDGRISRLNLEHLPASLGIPRVESALDAQYSLSGGPSVVQGEVVLGPSRLAGAHLTPGTTGTFERRAGRLRYRAEGAVNGLDLQRLGRELDLRALDRPGYASHVNARFSLEGADGALAPVQVSLWDSQLLKGQIPHMRLEARWAETGIRFTADGQFNALDPGTVVHRPDLHGSLTGTLSVEGTLPNPAEGFALDTVEADVRLALHDSAIAGSAIDTAVLSGRLAEGAVHLRELSLQGPMLDARVEGVYGLLPGAPATALHYDAEAREVSAFSSLIGQPVKGRVRVQGRMSGGEVLHLTGTMSGEDTGYGTLEAETMTGSYEAVVPAAEPAGARVAARLDATDVDAAGRRFGSVGADLTYAQERLAFDARLAEADQTLEAVGDLGWGETRDVRLQRLVLDAGDLTLRLADGHQAVLRVGGGLVTVDDLVLVGEPNQSISVAGTLGGERPMRVEATNVMLDPLDRWIGSEGLSGEVDATATIAGTIAAPRVSTDFMVTEGRVKGFDFTRLQGTATYSEGAVDFDTRLTRADASWIEAAGRVPTVAGGPASTPVQPMDVVVRSGPVGLEILQTFTDAVTEVEGTVQVDATVAGTLEAPQLAGRIVIRDGTFAVPFLGTRYTGLDTTIDLEGDAIEIGELTLLDGESNWLSAAGRLPLRRHQNQPLNLTVQTNNFEVLDNAYGDVEVDGTLTVTGTVTAPQVTGRVDVSSGNVVVDRLLELGQDPYETRAAELGLLDDARAGAPGGAPGLLADAPLTLDVRLVIPALVLQGRDIRGPGSLPVGLGNINAVAAGDLRLQKAAGDALRITGDVETVRGTYDFHGRRFELLRGGRIRFAGLAEINPSLDVTAQRVISAVDTRVHVRGTLQEPQIELSSQPPLDQADVLSLIVFNQPVNQLGVAQQVSLQQRATAMVSGFLAGQLTDVLGGTLGVDFFEVQTGAQDGVGPAVTIGEQIGSRLYVKLRQQFGPQDPSQFLIEYAVNDWLRLESSLSESGGPARPLLQRTPGSGLDAVLSFRY